MKFCSGSLVAQQIHGYMFLFLSLILALLMQGCSSVGHKEFYKQVAPTKYPATNKVMVFEYSSVNLRHVYDAFFSDYLIIGRSSFNGPYEKATSAISYAKSIGADVFISEATFQGTRHSSVPLTTPTYSTSYVNGFAGGSTFGGTVTTYGTQTTMIPIEIPRYDQEGLYLKNIKGVTPIWERREKDYPHGAPSGMDGLWRDEKYFLRLYRSGANCVAVIASASRKGSEWRVGDVKFVYNAQSGHGVYLVGNRRPEPANFALNKFGHLEVKLPAEKDAFSFARVGVK